MAAQHGGGSFLVLYILMVLLFGVVILSTEIAIGRMTRKSPIDAFTFLHPRSKWIGVLSVIVPTIILPYYCVIGGWIVAYIGTYAIGDTATTAGFFSDLVGSWVAVVAFIVFFASTIGVIWMGVSKGIERLSKIFLPILIVPVIILTIYTLQQPGMAEGLRYYLSFNLSDLDSGTFVAALGQAFFSLSLAMGIMLTYGSYMRKEDSIEGCAMSIGLISIGVALICGLLIVPMIFSLNSGDMPSGAGLVFDALPSIFDGMPAGTFVALAFFILLYIAAWTSAISVAEAITSTIVDRTGMSRKKAILLMTLPVLVAGIIISLGYGPLSFIHLGDQTILDILDGVVNKFIMPLVALATCILIGHVVGCKVIMDEIESSGKFRMKAIYPLLIKWVAPICIAIIFVSGLWTW